MEKTEKRKVKTNPGNNRIIIISIWNCLWNRCGVEQICSEGMSVVHVINLVATVWDSILLIVVTPTCDVSAGWLLRGECDRLHFSCWFIAILRIVSNERKKSNDFTFSCLHLVPISPNKSKVKFEIMQNQHFHPEQFKTFYSNVKWKKNPSKELAASDMHIANDIEKGRKELA